MLAVLVLLWGVWLWFGLSQVDAYRTRKGFFREAAALANGKPLYAYEYGSYDLQFYTARTVPILSEREDLRLVPGEGEEEVYVIAPTKQGPVLEALRYQTVLTRTWIDPFQPSHSNSLSLYARLPSAP
jgi:hypothetical protein